MGDTPLWKRQGSLSKILKRTPLEVPRSCFVITPVTIEYAWFSLDATGEIDRIHPSSNKFAMGVENEVKGDWKLYNSPVWAWLEMFSPLRGTNSKTTHYFLPFRHSTLKDTVKAPAEDHSTLNTLRLAPKRLFFSPERYDECACPIYMGDPQSNICLLNSTAVSEWVNTTLGF